MSRILTFGSRKFCVAWFVLQFTIIRASQIPICYHLDGSPYPNDDEVLPDGSIHKSVSCNPDQPISGCCNAHDLCLDNGLCMDFGPGDRVLVLQGCTDAAWRPPCPQYFAENRHDIPGADNRVILWLCSYDNDGEYCVGSPDGDGVSTWDASCCDNASKRIKSIPWFNSVHIAMEPKKRIEVMHLNLTETGNVNSDNDSHGLGTANTIALVAGIVAAVGVAVAFCQWQFPNLRIRRRRVAEPQANTSPPVGMVGPLTRLGDGSNDTELRAEDTIPYRDSSFESYSDSIKNAIEAEDGWKER